MIGVGLSLLLLVYRASKPRLSPLGADPRHLGAYEDLDRHPDATPVVGVLVIRPGAPVFYANDQLGPDQVRPDLDCGVHWAEQRSSSTEPPGHP